MQKSSSAQLHRSLWISIIPILTGLLMACACNAVVATSLVAEPEKQEGGNAHITIARPLKFEPNDMGFYIRFGGQNKLTILESATAVEKLLGKDTARLLVRLVDFDREQIVLVSWLTAGPPEGVLKHEIKGEGRNRRLVFYIQGPAGVQIRGQRARGAADFFAVPKDITVSFEAKERF